MKEYKLNMTRPEFMRRILTKGDRNHEITEADFEAMASAGYTPQYCCYTVLMGADLHPEDVLQVHDDSESIVVKLADKQLAKQVKEKFNKETIRLGDDVYRVKVKVDKTLVFVSVKLVEPDD